MPREQLTEREEIILAALVRAHVETGVPVGSAALLERDPHVGISAATVRKTLSTLEDKGYVQQPHTSAGRLPTDRGYRFFVAHTVDAVEAPVFDLEQQRREIERQLQKLSADEIHGQLAEIIGDVTMQLGLVMAPSFELGLLARIELVHLTQQRLLLVVNLTAGPVRSLVIEVGTSVERRDLEGVATRLNERLGGLTMSQVQTTVRERVGEDYPVGCRYLSDECIEDGNDVEDAAYFGAAASSTSLPSYAFIALVCHLKFLPPSASVSAAKTSSGKRARFSRGPP